MEKFIKLGLLMLSYLESEQYTGRLLLIDGMNVMMQPEDGALEEAINALSDGNGQLDVPGLLAAAKSQLFANSSDNAILNLVQMVKSNNMDGIIETLLHIDFSSIGTKEHEEGLQIINSLPPAFRGLINKVTSLVPVTDSETVSPVEAVSDTTKLFNQLSHGQMIMQS